MTKTVVPKSLDDYFQATHLGSIEAAVGNNLYGLNHRQTPTMVPMNKDSYGLTFFTRPQLNMTSDNLRSNRLFYPLLTTREDSMQRFVRTTLDPRLASKLTGVVSRYGDNFPLTKEMIEFLKPDGVGSTPCPFVDPLQAFIPVLTNNLTAISGWPDMTIDMFKSKPGVYKEVYSQVDGITRNYESYDIDATFRNTKGDPILYMFYVWLHYMACVFEDTMSPWPDFVFNNVIDYNTRIYRLVLDYEKNKVTKIAACGVATPISVPTGQFFDYTNTKPYNDQSKDITIRFSCLGFQALDDILIDEFNKTVCIFNPNMHDQYRESGFNGKEELIKIDRHLLHLFNNRGYPRINPDNYELEWWIFRADFEERMTKFLYATSSVTEGDGESVFTGD